MQTDSIYSREPLRIVDGISVFTEPDEYSDNYETIGGVLASSILAGKGNPWGANQDEAFSHYMALVKRYHNESSVMLDAGIGYGAMFDYIAPTPSTYGVDLSMRLLGISASKGVKVSCARVEDLPYRSGSFDIVCAKDILEHVFDLYGTVKELHRVLKPSGRLVIQCPYNQSMETYYHYKEFKWVHVRTLDEWNLLMLFEKIFGFKCLQYNKVMQGKDTEIAMLLEKS